MGINVSIGDAKVDYSTYSYTVWTNAVEPVATATADPSNPRIDRIVGYVDRSVTPSSVTTNNPGLLKFMSIAGTPSASPARPSNVTIQTAVGASNPYFDIADVLVGTGVTQITTGNITDTRLIVTVDTVDSKHAAELSQVGDIIMSLRTTPGTNRLFMAGGNHLKVTFPLLWALQPSHPAYFTTSDATTFTLADMRQRVPVGRTAAGTFPTLGGIGGAETHILTTAEMPAHNHTLKSSTSAGNFSEGVAFGNDSTPDFTTSTPMNNTGSGAAHNNLQPYIVINYEVIAG